MLSNAGGLNYFDNSLEREELYYSIFSTDKLRVQMRPPYILRNIREIDPTRIYGTKAGLDNGEVWHYESICSTFIHITNI